MADHRRRAAFGHEGGIFRQQARRAGEDDVGAVGQRPGQAGKCFAAHEDDAAGSEFLEPLEFFRQVPRDLAVLPDGPVLCHGDNGFHFTDG
jgi:hypothetical protein